MADSGERWASRAVRPERQDKEQYHIRCRPGDVAPYVLLPGDPDRVPKIAATWQSARAVARSREYATYSGTYRGVSLSAVSTGIGGPSTAIAIEELAEVGAHTFIRVGTTGAIPAHVEPGQLVIATAAVRWDGTTTDYIDPAYPAVAHHEVTLALIEAAERLGHPYHVGICATTASFHCGQDRPGYSGYASPQTEGRIAAAARARVLSFEMEAAVVLTLANLFALRAGAVFAVVANRSTDTFRYEGVEACIAVANEAVAILSEWDRAKATRGKALWYPSLHER